MRCLIVTTLERQIWTFLIPHIHLLEEMGYEVTIATSLTEDCKLHTVLPNVHLHHIPFSRYIKNPSNFRAFLEIRKLLRRNFDLVHVHSPIASFVTRMAATMEQTIIYTAHGFHFHENGSKLSNRLFYLAEKTAGRKTKKLVVINDYDYEKALTFLPDEKIHYIHGIGVDTRDYCIDNYTPLQKQHIKKRLDVPIDKIVITHIAEFNENKRQIDIVKATEKLKDRNENFVVLLVGDGVLLEQIENEIQRLNLGDYVRCLGFRQDINDILSITDIGILVSMREGLPKSLMEMMAMNIPVIGTNIRGNRDLIDNGENGYLIPSQSPNDLMSSLLHLLENEELRMEMGEKSREKMVTKYDLNIILTKMKQIYESIKEDTLSKGRTIKQ